MCVIFPAIKIKMNYFVFLVQCSYIFATEVQNTICVDGIQCPSGKFCCESGCCDTSKELQDKSYVPGLPPASTFNETLSMAEPRARNLDCLGTQCGPYCHSDATATCCNDPRFACNVYGNCCNSPDSEFPWCCAPIEKCSPIKNKCINPFITCFGTKCGSHCHHALYLATCCKNPKFACRSYEPICCSDSNSDHYWCCKENQQCSSVADMCINSADSTPTIIMSVLFLTMFAVASKYFL